MISDVLRRYAKFAVAVTTAGAAFITALLTDPTVSDALADNRISSSEWRLIALAVIGAILVRQVPNRPPVGEAADPTISEQG